MPEYSRRVTLSVSIDGHDVAGDFAPYLLDFSYKDEAGGKSDDIQITLQNKDGRFSGPWRPKKGMEVIASIICEDWEFDGDYQELPCGSFQIDEVELSGPPDKIRIKAVSASLSGGLRDTQKTRAWENTSLQTVTDQIAQENNLEPMYIGEDVRFERQDQRNESDISFLNRLAGDYGMNCKAHNGKLIMFDSEEAEKADETMEIAKTGSMYSPKSYSFKMSSSGTDYDKAEVAYTDPKTGKTQKASAKSESKDTKKSGTDKTLTLNQRVENASQAMKLSRSKLHKENQKEETASLECMGCPRLVAGVNVNLTGFEEFSGKWCIKSATHKLSGSGGYSVSMELTAPALTEEVRAEENISNYDDDNQFTSELQKEIFIELKEKINKGGTEIEKLLISLPDIISSLVKKCFLKINKIGYRHLQRMFYRWFTSLKNLDGNEDPYIVDMEWILEFARVRLACAEITNPTYLMSPKALERLTLYLKEKGYLGNEERSFNFTNLPWPERDKAAFQFSIVPGMESLDADGLMAAMGNFQFRALAGGKIIPIPSGGHKIIINKLSIFAQDSFNFEGDQSYGYWSKKDRDFSRYKKEGYVELTNEAFRNFAEDKEYGKDFPIISDCYPVENFAGIDYVTDL